jgi:hypothetical protein
MRRSGVVRRLVGFLAGTAILLSVATPARAQFDPITLSLIMGGVQLVTGVAAAITLGLSQDGKQQGIATPNGTPCGLVDGVPQICWQPHNGGFEGSPDLPTGAKPFTAPTQSAPSMELEIRPLEPASKTPTAGQ